MSRVVITGIAGTIGRLLARALHLDHEVIGLDRRDLPGKPKDIAVFAYDIRRKRCESIFRNQRIDTVFHLNVMHDFRLSQAELHGFNVVGTQRLLEYVARYGVKKFIFLSTANVYGARAENPQFLTEDSLLLASDTFSEMRSLITMDMMVTSFFWKNPGVETVVLRPAHILGTVKNGPSRYLSLPIIPTVLGFDPMLQVLHESEVVRALVLAMKPGSRGIYNVAGPSPMPLSAIVSSLGKRHAPMPYAALKKLAQKAWDFGLGYVPPPEIDFLRYPCLVDDSRARQELGFKPELSFARTLELLKASEVFKKGGQ
jgi:UDP-glucose 4-epimerase